MVKLRVFGQAIVSPVDTAATSIWVDGFWFRQKGGRVTSRRGDACAADGHEIQVAGGGVLGFQKWGVTFTKDVPVMSTFPYKVFVGRRFWKKDKLCLNLGKKIAFIVCNENHVQEFIVHNRMANRQKEELEDVKRLLKTTM